jgi:uncharacterized protein YhaN
MSLRFERIDFNAWGCFAEHSLDFGKAPGEVDLIYGENATGKSTSGRGLRSLLFGIAPRTKDNHSHPYSELRIGARLLLGGEPLELARLKKRSGSLLGADGQPLGGDPIRAALGGLSEEAYAGLFYIDDEALTRGGEDLLRGGGEVGESLFSAAAGIRALHEILTGLDSEAEANYNPPRGRKGRLERALRVLGEAEKEERTALVRPSRHSAMSRALRKAEEASEEISREIREIESQRRAIERRRAIAPLLDTHAARHKELAPIEATPDLAPDAAAERAAAQARLTAGVGQHKRAEEQLAAVVTEIEEIDVDEGLLGSAAAISDLRGEISTVAKAGIDRRKLEGERHEAEASLRATAETIGVEVEEIGSLSRPAAARRSLDSCVSRHEEIASALAGAEERLGKARAARERAAAEFAKAPDPGDLASLDAALSEALAAAPLAEQADATELERRLSADKAARALQELRPAPATLAALRELELPSLDQVRKASEAVEELAALAGQLDTDREGLAARRGEQDELEGQMEAEGEVPSAEELAEARRRREQLWSPIRSEAERGAPLDPGTAQSFEAAVAESDHLADRRTDGAARIERAAALEAAGQRLSTEESALASRGEKLSVRSAAAAEHWSSLWSKSGLEQITPQAALEWLEQRDQALLLDAEAGEAARRAAALREREEAKGRALRAELAARGSESAESAELGSLVSRAQRLLGENREAAATRIAAATTLEQSKEALAGAESDLERTGEAEREWGAAWPERLQESGLPAGTDPEAAQEIVRTVSEALSQARTIENLKRRIAGIDSDREGFERRAAELCAALAPELSELDAERGVSVLHARLSEHERERERLKGLGAQKVGAEAALAKVEDEIATAEALLGALLAAAGAEEVEQLPVIEQRSERARELRKEIAAIEQQVTEAGEGRFEELAQGAEDFDREAAAGEIERLGEEIDAHRLRRDDAREEIGRQRQELTDAEIDTDAVRAREDAELARGEVEAAAHAYATALVSSRVVRRSIERYRDRHQGPMVERADELFARFTQRTFSKLYVDVAEGEAFLVGRQYDGVLKRVEEMSEGTREQLYLALRIAAIERFVETTGPVPVTFDDVFSESDEPRSQRIFEALGELATKTQVIVLTHHRYLIEVGRRALGEKLLVQELPEVAPSLRVAEAA